MYNGADQDGQNGKSRLNELSRTEPELVIVASHDEEQHIELTRQRLLSSQLE